MADTRGTPGSAQQSAASAAGAAPVSYGRGFFDAEKDDAGQIWHWMGPEGIVLLPNNGRNSRMKITAGAPIAKARLRLDIREEAVRRDRPDMRSRL